MDFEFLIRRWDNPFLFSILGDTSPKNSALVCDETGSNYVKFQCHTCLTVGSITIVEYIIYTCRVCPSEMYLWLRLVCYYSRFFLVIFEAISRPGYVWQSYCFLVLRWKWYGWRWSFERLRRIYKIFLVLSDINIFHTEKTLIHMNCSNLYLIFLP